jgi:hypothetical protein
MPDLESQIAEWRQQMSAGGFRSVEVLEELECHLRDDLAAQKARGVEEKEAFAASVARLGGVDALKREFDKVGGAARRRARTLFLTLAGIPDSYQTNIMNTTTTSSDLEPRWATYTKAAVFLIPAVSLWTFAVMFLMPKLQAVCREAGVLMPWPYQVTSFFAGHWLTVLLIVALPLALVEWRWSRWPAFRRMSLGGAVFVLNAGVMALITLLLILALYVAPALMQRS